MRPFVDVALPAVLPVREPLGSRSGVVHLVEVHRSGLVQPPEPIPEGNQHQRQQEHHVEAVEPPRRITKALLRDRGSPQPRRCRRAAASRGRGRRRLRGCLAIGHLLAGAPSRLTSEIARQEQQPTQREHHRGGDEIDAPRRPRIDDAGIERPVRRVDPVHVGEEREREDRVQRRPPPVAQEEQRPDRQGREQVALVNPGGQHEECDRYD